MLHYISEFPKEWEGFNEGRWCNTSVNVRDFIKKNYTPYDGDESFLEGPTDATVKLWDQIMDLSRQEREAGGVLDMDTSVVSTITSHPAGYLNKDLEQTKSVITYRFTDIYDQYYWTPALIGGGDSDNNNSN